MPSGLGAPALRARSPRDVCRAMLPRVSRTFALNIGLLRGSLGDAVLLAYLFCRIADTIEDAPHLAPGERVRLLEAYRSLFPVDEGWRPRVRDFAAFWGPRGEDGDDLRLCAAAEQVFAAFLELDPAYRGPVERCVGEMCVGMGRFASRRAAHPRGELRVESAAELDEYCHYVAGTVGTMLCELFVLAHPVLGGSRAARLRALAGRFGQAMQLTNILKDVPEDVRRGALFVPRSLAEEHGIDPARLLDPAVRPQARAVLRALAARAAGALDDAVEFTLLLPKREVRLRLFCLWPLVLAARTLRRVVGDDGVFEAGARVRIGRPEVRRSLGLATAVVLSDRAVRRLYGRWRPLLEPEPLPLAGEARVLP